MGHDNFFSGGFREGLDEVWLAAGALTSVVMDLIVYLRHQILPSYEFHDLYKR